MEYLLYSVLEDDAWVHKHGADKYGVRNWRKDKILTSTYEASILRHFLAWAGGEDIDPESGKPHLTHLRAGAGIVMDAQKHGTLIDDRTRVESKDVKLEIGAGTYARVGEDTGLPTDDIPRGGGFGVRREPTQSNESFAIREEGC